MRVRAAGLILAVAVGAAATVFVGAGAASAAPGALTLSVASAPNNGPVSVKICADGIDAGAQVTLERDIEGSPIPAAESSFMQDDLFGCALTLKESIVATFDLSGHAPGNWTLVLRNSDGTSSSTSFGVGAAGTPTFASPAVTPSTVFVGTTVDVTLHGSNLYRGSTVRIADGDADSGNDVVVVSRTWVDTSTVVARLQVPGHAPLGAEDILFSNSDGSSKTCPDCLILDDPNRRFVDAVYHQLLGRAPDPLGQAYWLGELRSGRPRTDTAGALLASDEFRGRVVQELFGSILGRPADAAGLEYWIAVLREGALYANIQSSLLGSPEFLGRVGGSRSRFLDSAYVFTLGRLPDPSGRNYWNQQMDRGLSRADVALVLATSPESRYRLVDAYYRTFLHRPVDPEGGTYWALSMALQGMREEVVLAALVGGEEFKSLNG